MPPHIEVEITLVELTLAGLGTLVLLWRMRKRLIRLWGRMNGGNR